MDFNLILDNQSEIQLIFDEEVGDVIKGYGQGDLYLKLSDEEDFEIFGDFEIEQGNYLFTLQDVITKSFIIDRGGGISFNGSIENAILDLNLLYNIQASLHMLNPDYDRDKKSNVICRMAMTGPLLNPEINFFIEASSFKIISGGITSAPWRSAWTRSPSSISKPKIFTFVLISIART